MTTLVFPGQGSQFVGMTKDFYDNFEIVKETFDVIESASNLKIKDIIFEDSGNLLNITQYTQLAIFSSSMAIFNALKNNNNFNKMNINYLLGHSLGEYSALVASEIISIQECSKLLKIRGELMHNSYEENMSGMVAIIGLKCSQIENIILGNNLNLDVANDNSPIQVVISGTMENLNQAKSIFIGNGAKKYVFLNVSAAFHSRIMNDAEKEMSKQIDMIEFKNPKYPIISNYSGKMSIDTKIIVYNLKNQMSNKVKWVESINQLLELNENNIIEIGPGKVLNGLIKRISNNFTLTNINTINDFESFINAI